MAQAAPDDFATWVAGTHARLLRSAYLLTGSGPLAEDLVQDAMIKVAQRWPRLRDQNPTAYARTIIHRDHATWWRRRRESPVADHPERPGIHDHDAVERRMVVSEALAGLTRSQRAVLVLRYFDDLTERETADALGVSIGTVKSQASAALRKLRVHDGLGVLRGRDL